LPAGPSLLVPGSCQEAGSPLRAADDPLVRGGPCWRPSLERMVGALLKLREFPRPDTGIRSEACSRASEPVCVRSDWMSALYHLAEQVDGLGANTKRCFGQNDAGIQRQPGISAGLDVEIGLEQALRHVFGDDPKPIARQFLQNRSDVLVAKVLKHLPDDDDVAGWQSVDRGIEAMKCDVRGADKPAIAVYQSRHDVAGMVMASEIRDPASDGEVAAADVDHLGRLRQRRQNGAHSGDIWIDEMGRVTAAA
jgi:hypothetical protein